MGDKLNGEEYFAAGAAAFNYNNVVSNISQPLNLVDYQTFSLVSFGHNIFNVQSSDIYYLWYHRVEAVIQLFIIFEQGINRLLEFISFITCEELQVVEVPTLVGFCFIFYLKL